MFSLKNKKQKRAVFVLAVLLFSSGVFFLSAHSTSAATGFSWTDLLTTNPFKTLLYGIFWVLGIITSMAITLFEWAVTPEYISGNGGLLNRASVYEMWKLIRDFFNLFFILTLLYTAFTIVFQVAKNYKQTLLSIILAALFVNFSFPITRVIIDMTNVPMYYFINQIGSTGKSEKDLLGTVLSASKIQGILIPGSGTGNDAGSVNGKSLGEVGISQLLMAIVFLFIFTISLLVLAILFVVRLVALIILVIFSSVGFAASVIPGMQKYGNMWWEKLAQYALLGPSAMLMLFIATRFFSEIAQDNTKAQFVQSTLANATPENAGFISSMAMFTVPIIMLWFAIGIGVSSSIVGAGAVVGLGYAAIKGAGKLVTKSPAGFAYRKIDSKFLAPRGLSPTAWKMAFKQRSEEQKHKDEQPIKLAAATGQDQLNSVMSRVKNTIVPTNWLPKNWDKLGKSSDHTDHRFAERQSQKAEHAKKITEVSDREDIVIEHLDNAVKGKLASETEAALTVLVKNNDLNSLIMSRGVQYGGTDEVSSENVKTVLTNILRQSGVTDKEDIAKTLMVLSDQAMAAGGNFAFGGMSHYDAGDFDIASRTQQADAVASKFNNLEPQKQATMLHPDSLFKRQASAITPDNKSGFTDLNDEVAEALIKRITKATADQSNRSRSDMRSALQNAYEQVTLHGSKAFPKFESNYNANPNFRYYIGKMLDQNGALPTGVDPKDIAGTMPVTI